MARTRQIRRTDVISTEPIRFIRAIDIRFDVTNTRPNTRIYPFFDGIQIDQWSRSLTGQLGDHLVTDAAGNFSGIFSVPPMTFQTGSRLLRIQDNPVFNAGADIAGSTMGSATAEFTALGTLRRIRDTVTNITTVTVTNVVDEPPRPPADPLAQTFFTYGVTGGCVITKIDIWFQTKDENIPITLELREVENGYPSARLVNRHARSVLSPARVNVSNDSSVPTSFVFPRPIYLEENRDYCFVLLANTNGYNAWTATIGERSRETGVNIFEQPFIGTLFKSENNITWSAYQTEDIKFRIWRAEFNTNVSSSLNFIGESRPVLVPGDHFGVTSGSPTVTVRFDHLHGLTQDSRITLRSIPNTTMRGIPASALTGDFPVNSIIDENTITFNISVVPTSTGTLESAERVLRIDVDAGGSGYNLPPIVTISPPSAPGGVQATAVAEVANGSIFDIRVTNAGSGYTTTPTITLTGAGSGAVLTPITNTALEVTTNRVTNVYAPIIHTRALPNTEMSVSYQIVGETYNRLTLNNVNFERPNIQPKTSLIISNANRIGRLFGEPPTRVKVNLVSSNSNTSPLIDLNEFASLTTAAYIINNQEGEILTATTGTGSIASIVVTSGGSGYTGIPNVQIIGNGTGGAATAVVANGIITGINVTNTGTGYTQIPSIVITGGGGSGGAAQVVLTPFNTELLPSGGSAKSKYITRHITLDTVSNGIRLYSSIYSEQASNVDFYIRTSLSGSGVNHAELNWVKLGCQVERNLSTRFGQYFDYTFSLDDIPDFDVYDIKCVLRSTNRNTIPIVANFRNIILST